MKQISDFVIDLRSAYLSLFNLLCNEFIQRGVYITNSMDEKCALSGDDKSMGFVAFKIEAKEYSVTFSLFSKIKNGEIHNRVMIMTKEPDRYANFTERFPVEFLEKVEVLNMVALFLKGEINKPYGLINFIDELARDLKKS